MSKKYDKIEIQRPAKKFFNLRPDVAVLDVERSREAATQAIISID
jgi:hypothetical protein